MSDFRDPNDPLRRDQMMQNLPPDDSMSSNATWGWVAAAIFAIVVLFLAFTASREGTQTASNNPAPPAASTQGGPAMTPHPGPTTSGSAAPSASGPAMAPPSGSTSGSAAQH